MHFRYRNALRRILPWVVALAALAFLAACTQPGNGTPGTPRGTVSGTLSYGPTGTTVGGSSLGPTEDTSARIAVARMGTSFELSMQGRDADFVPGEIVVKFLETGDATAMAPFETLQAAGVALARARTLALPGAALYRAATTDRAGTLAAIDALNARPDVAFAHPNYILESFLAPDDELYPSMWHYPFVDLEGAWDVTTGSSDTVVAVLDTGMLMNHPDRPRNLLSGYDFVSDPNNTDGNGRDSDPTDPGPGSATGYHGSHVIGTLAAAANNNYDGDAAADGMAGVSWFTSVLPVRVLDAAGGTIADIADAVVWSVGGSVSGVPANASPADIVNLSLGAGVACSQTPLLQDAINQAFTRGASVVAAAGNGGQDGIGDDASGTTPASCTNVLTVGAWEVVDERAPYSNWGDPVDLMAPGGSPDPGTDTNGDGEPDGVLGLGYNDGTANYTFTWMAGTSMATPHVAGVMALMLDANPDLTRTDLRNILMDTATSYTSSQCSAGQSISSAGTACGAGILDARAAVEAAALASPPPTDGTLAFEPESVALGTGLSSATVTLSNTGSSSLSWEILGAEGDPDNPATIGDDVLFADPISDTISGGGTQNLLVQIDRSRVTTSGAYAAYYLFDLDGDTSTAEVRLPVTFIIPGDSGTTASGPMTVEALLTSTWARSGGVSSSGVIFDYTFSVTPGSNYVYAWSDEDRNGIVSSGDWYGDAPSYVQVDAGESVAGVDFSLTYVTSREAVAETLPQGVTLEAIEGGR